jgi:hypothetical protein
MACGHIKKRIKVNSKNYAGLLEKLKGGLINFKIRTDDGIKDVICTLQESILPSKKSNQFEDKNINDQLQNETLTVWAFNKNYTISIDPSSGWCKIPISSIDDYEIL